MKHFCQLKMTEIRMNLKAAPSTQDHFAASSVFLEEVRLLSNPGKGQGGCGQVQPLKQ